jgi:hypothetical protein
MRWNNDVCFLLVQDSNNVRSLKLQSVGRHVATLGQILEAHVVLLGCYEEGKMYEKMSYIFFPTFDKISQRM